MGLCCKHLCIEQSFLFPLLQCLRVHVMASSLDYLLLFLMLEYPPKKYANEKVRMQLE